MSALRDATPGRPGRLVLVTGTGTEVGKTWWAAALAHALLARDVGVAARKPVQSFDGHDPVGTDADLLAAATGADAHEVCPPHRWLPVPMAPPMAAEVLGHEPFDVADLVAELAWPAGCAVGLVETAGGPRSPLAADGDTVDFARALVPDLVLLVGDSGLGTINAVRLAVGVLPTPLVVALNRFDADEDLHRRNRALLAEHHDVVVDPVEVVARLAR